MNSSTANTIPPIPDHLSQHKTGDHLVVRFYIVYHSFCRQNYSRGRRHTPPVVILGFETPGKRARLPPVRGARGHRSAVRARFKSFSAENGAEEPMTSSGGNLIGSGVRNARKTIQWIVFSGERGEEPMTSSGGNLIGSEVN